MNRDLPEMCTTLHNHGGIQCITLPKWRNKDFSEHQVDLLCLSHQSVDSNPGRDTCVLEQDILLQVFPLHLGV